MVPATSPPFVWAWYAGAVLAVVAVTPLVRRRLRPGLARVLVVLVLLIPISVISLLHVSLRRDCLQDERAARTAAATASCVDLRHSDRLVAAGTPARHSQRQDLSSASCR